MNAPTNLADKLREPPAEVATRADPERYFRLGENLLRQVRAELIDADAAWRRKRAELVDRAKDELSRIDHEHDEKVARLRGMIGRLEAIRNGGT
jgi:hypothetical protein